MEDWGWEVSAGQAFFDGDVRVDKIIWLAGIQANHNDDFEELLENEGAEKIGEIVGLDFNGYDDADEETIICELCNRGIEGFFVLCVTPVKEIINANGTQRCSWGWCVGKWFYTECLDQHFVDANVIPWVDDLTAKAIEKFKAKEAK